MKCTIVSYRRGRRTQYDRQMLISNETVKNKEDAEKLVGKEVVWKSSTGKEIKGKISAPHGGNGVMRAIFEKGLPGQALGEKVEIK